MAALATETAVIEHERAAEADRVCCAGRSTRVRDLVAQGRLEGGENIGRLGLHDGMLIIDADGHDPVRLERRRGAVPPARLRG